ncbi:MAG: alkaline phosphatase family protein [Armatimonadetes bacterium]|nr:alkaline phosphatase family protein [Armatimonadota bacterium]
MLSMIALAALAPTAALPKSAPKLVLLISVDQGRADYVDRFSDHFLPAKAGGKLGGYQWLGETGVRYTDAHHHHVPTYTAAGHAILTTGSVPAINGVIGNEWYDRKTGKVHYSTEDKDAYQTVGGTMDGMSCRPLLVSTVGDELKMATNGRSKVVGISFKDRAGILMAGHAADQVVWFDNGVGKFVTSTYYGTSVPKWAEDFNKSGFMDSFVGKSWNASMPASAYANARNAPHVANQPKNFSHPYGTEVKSSYYSAVAASEAGQRAIFDLATRAVDTEKLGSHETPDILVVNLATNDYVGHAYGPNSPEVMDITVVTDKLLSEFFNHLNKAVPGGIDNVAIILTADHGVAPIPAEARDTFKLDAGRVSGADILKAVDSALDQQFGDADWAPSFNGFNLYLNREAIAAKGLNRSDVEEAAAEAAMTADGVWQAYTRTNVLKGLIPDLPLREWITNGLNPINGGDVVVIFKPDYVETGATGTSHGAIWAYDTHVPIMTRWGGQKPRKVARRVYTHDIASTLCTLLGIEYPNGNIGEPLFESLPGN